MAPNTSANRPSYVYAGLAGETTPGRVVKSGLYRMTNDDGGWELLTNGLPEAPAIRAIAVHPLQSEVMYVGTQHGPFRSTDHGNHWEKVNVPDHGLPVWSLMFHPRAIPKSFSLAMNRVKSTGVTMAGKPGASCP